MDSSERRASRKARMVAHVAHDFSDAERWDLDFWQSQTPETRLSALVAIRKDVANVLAARGNAVGGQDGEVDWMP